MTRSRLWKSCLLSAEEKQALQDATEAPFKVKAGFSLAQEAGRADRLFILREGWAGRYLTTARGGRQFSALMLPGDIANLDSLNFERLDYGVRTLTPAVVIAIARDTAISLAARHSGIARLFTWLAMVEHTTLSAWTLSLGRRRAAERLGHLLCEIALRLSKNGRPELQFPWPLRQEQLGDVLGLSTVHVNRTLQDLRSADLVATDGRSIALPDFERLSQICDFDPSYLHLSPEGGYLFQETVGW